MIDLFVQIFLGLNKILFNNLGLTIIVIGVVSRIIIYPFFTSSIRASKKMRELKPKTDEIKRKYKGDSRRIALEQSKLMQKAGVSPAASLVGCFSVLIQLGVFILLFQSITRVVAADVETWFLFLDLAQPDAVRIQGLPFPVPGVLVLLTAAATFILSKMALPEPQAKPKEVKKEEKPDFAEALSASQGPMAYFIPLIILFWGVSFASGLILYWFTSTILGIIQQYVVTGPGSLKPWLTKILPQR